MSYPILRCFRYPGWFDCWVSNLESMRRFNVVGRGWKELCFWEDVDSFWTLNGRGKWYLARAKVGSFKYAQAYAMERKRWNFVTKITRTWHNQEQQTAWTMNWFQHLLTSKKVSRKKQVNVSPQKGKKRWNVRVRWIQRNMLQSKWRSNNSPPTCFEMPWLWGEKADGSPISNWKSLVEI